MKDSEFINYSLFLDNLIHHTKNDLESGLYDSVADDLDMIHRILNGGYYREIKNFAECE